MPRDCSPKAVAKVMDIRTSLVRTCLNWSTGGLTNRWHGVVGGWMTTMMLVGAVLCGSAQRVDQPITDPEAYSVYSILIAQEWPVRIAHAKSVVLQRETIVRACLPSGSPMETEWKPVLDD